MAVIIFLGMDTKPLNARVKDKHGRQVLYVVAVIAVFFRAFCCVRSGFYASKITGIVGFYIQFTGNGSGILYHPFIKTLEDDIAGTLYGKLSCPRT